MSRALALVAPPEPSLPPDTRLLGLPLVRRTVLSARRAGFSDVTVVGAPADDYVANFVRDIPRSNVLTLRWIMRPAAAGEEDGPRLPVATTIRDAVATIASSERPVCAVEDERVVGVVDRTAVLRAIAGEED